MEKEYLIKKWLKDELSEAEAKSFNAMGDSHLYKEIVLEARRFKGDEQFETLSFSKLEKRLKPKAEATNNNWLKLATSIAAVFVIGIAIYSVLNFNSAESFGTDYAQNEVITLPDHSIVNLNELSQIEYNASKWNEKRTLDLTGEAFFDVAKGKRFDVKTDQGIVSVLGTEFNVLSRDSIFKVTCYEGLVAVTYNNETLELPVGTEFTLINGNAKKTNIVVSEPYWIKNMSVFENTSLKNVMFELEKQYKVKVIYTSENNVNFTGAFEHGNLDNALRSITQPLNLTYMTEDNKVILWNAED